MGAKVLLCLVVLFSLSPLGLGGEDLSLEARLAPLIHEILTHEVVHCYQNTIWSDMATAFRIPKWIKEGSALQKKTQSAAEERFGDVSSKMTSMAEDVTAKAGKQWDKLETIFEERTAKAMKKLGVPSAKDVQALKERIEALSAQVARGAGSAARKTAAKSSAKSVPRKAAKRARKSAA